MHQTQIDAGPARGGSGSSAVPSDLAAVALGEERSLGNFAVFTAFVEETHADARRLALALSGGDPHQAADLHQTALERLWRTWTSPRFRLGSRSDQRAGIENPGAYLRTTIVRVHATGRRRHAVRREQVVAEPHEAAGTAPRAVVRASEQDAYADATELATALAALPLRQRQAVVLRYLEDLPVSEVAALMECTPGTVKRAAYDGIRALRGQLAPAPLTTSTTATGQQQRPGGPSDA